MAERKSHDVKQLFACGKPWYKKWWIIGLIVIILIAIILIAIPSMIDDAYMRGLTLTEPNTTFSSSDLLGFYGSFLAFIGTVALGVLAIYQNIKANNLSNRLVELDEKRFHAQYIPFLKVVESTVTKIDIQNYSGNAYSTCDPRFEGSPVDDAYELSIRLASESDYSIFVTCKNELKISKLVNGRNTKENTCFPFVFNQPAKCNFIAAQQYRDFKFLFRKSDCIINDKNGCTCVVRIKLDIKNIKCNLDFTEKIYLFGGNNGQDLRALRYLMLDAAGMKLFDFNTGF
ncbi:MAG: hypothetical protein RR313_12770 [Anaerovoracaceae bacterium]